MLQIENVPIICKVFNLIFQLKPLPRRSLADQGTLTQPGKISVMLSRTGLAHEGCAGAKSNVETWIWEKLNRRHVLEKSESVLASVDKCPTQKFLWESALLLLPGLREVINKKCFSSLLSPHLTLCFLDSNYYPGVRDFPSSPVTKSLLRNNPKPADTNLGVSLKPGGQQLHRARNVSPHQHSSLYHLHFQRAGEPEWLQRCFQLPRFSYAPPNPVVCLKYIVSKLHYMPPPALFLEEQSITIS